MGLPRSHGWPRVGSVRATVRLSVGALLVSSAPSAAQSVEGVLLERGTDRPIELGLVALLTAAGDSIVATLTDSEGRFSLVSGEGGEFLLTASALGYEATVVRSILELPEGSSMTVEFRIEPLAVEIAGLSVEATASLMSQPNLVRTGFVERARAGFGRFITPKDIEESRALGTTDLLARTGRVLTQYQVGGDRIRMLGQFGYCEPFVYLDGVRLPADVSLDAIAPMVVLDAVEIYRSAVEAPPQYAVGVWRCGVILLWTKTG